MIAFDTNILVYAHREDSPFHVRAKECVRAAAEGSEPWAIPWPCVHEFLSIVTHPKIFKTPTPMESALKQVTAWMKSPSLVLLAEDRDGYWEVLSRLLRTGKIQGGKVHDARVAAMSVHHAVDVLHSADRDFSRFPELPLKNPL